MAITRFNTDLLKMEKKFDKVRILLCSSKKIKIEKEENVSITFFEDDVITVRLLGITEPSRCDNEGIHDAINDKCQETQLDITNSCVTTAVDGASVNFGKNNGVLTRLQSSML